MSAEPQGKRILIKLGAVLDNDSCLGWLDEKKPFKLVQTKQAARAICFRVNSPDSQ